MEILDLAQKKGTFVKHSERYDNPHREAMRLRLVWTYGKPPSKTRDTQEARHVHKEVLEKLGNNEVEDALRLIRKGLFLDPKFHLFYALRGDVLMRQGRFSEAIRNYENARSMAKFDKRLSEAETKTLYNRKLVEGYTKRASFFYENDMLLEAVGDYEQVLVLKLRGMSVVEVQDKLLASLRTLEKYEAFQIYWHRFLTDVDSHRASILLTKHAEYKIHLREMSAARHMLFEAIDLDEDNEEAQDLLQVVFDTGHAMAAFTIVWCMHGSYDKALLTIEKGRECDPYNPGYTLLKTIILRLSGRLSEAAAWLETIDKVFYKLLEPSRDKHGSIMGKLTIEETRNELINQWYLIRYDMAVESIQRGDHKKAYQIIKSSNLHNYYMEPYLLLGDCFLEDEEPDDALEMYRHSQKKARELHHLPRSQKRIQLLDRIIDILNSRANMAAGEKRGKTTIEISNEILRILDENHVDNDELGVQRGRALLHQARGEFQVSRTSRCFKKSCEKTAESLRFFRGPEDRGIYRSLYGNTGMEEVIDRFARPRKLPQSLKILMQYSS